MAKSKDMSPLEGFGKVFWQNQFRTTIDLPDRDGFPELKGKVGLITGANSGLGFEASKQLLTLGLSHLVVTVRSQEKAESTTSALQALNTGANIDAWLLDMESYDSIRMFTQRCETELVRIDYVILNAGGSPTSFIKANETGHETTIQVNHLSTALLTVLLLPILKSKAHASSSPPRITVVNSLTAHLCQFQNRHQRPLLDSFDDVKLVPYDARERYGVSKLLNQLFLVKLADMVPSEMVTINMVDPGLTKGTRLSRDARGIVRLAANLFFAVCGRPVDRGAATYIYALIDHGRESHGCFIMSNKVAPLAGIYYTTDGTALLECIWNETLHELGFANEDEFIRTLG